MDWIEKVLNILGILSIPSILWNIYQYHQNKKIRELDLEKSLKKKELELEELFNKQESEQEDVMKNIEGEIGYRNPTLYINFLTKSDKKSLSKLYAKHEIEYKKLFADIDHYRKLLGRDVITGVKNTNVISKILNKAHGIIEKILKKIKDSFHFLDR